MRRSLTMRRKNDQHELNGANRLFQDTAFMMRRLPFDQPAAPHRDVAHRQFLLERDNKFAFSIRVSRGKKDNARSACCQRRCTRIFKTQLGRRLIKNAAKLLTIVQTGNHNPTFPPAHRLKCRADFPSQVSLRPTLFQACAYQPFSRYRFLIVHSDSPPCLPSLFHRGICPLAPARGQGPAAVPTGRVSFLPNRSESHMGKTYATSVQTYG